jgi:hypothetical protein
MRTVSLLAVGVLAAGIGHATAQEEPPGDPLGVIQDCAVVPTPEGQLAPPPTESLTDTLAPCNGVIAPPPAGDADITITPPAGGETPVIPPGQVPEQPANPE